MSSLLPPSFVPSHHSLVTRPSFFLPPLLLFLLSFPSTSYFACWWICAKVDWCPQNGSAASRPSCFPCCSHRRDEEKGHREKTRWKIFYMWRFFLDRVWEEMRRPRVLAYLSFWLAHISTLTLIDAHIFRRTHTHTQAHTTSARRGTLVFVFPSQS